MWLSALATLVGGVGVTVWGLLTREGLDRVMVMFLAVVIVVGTVLAVWRHTWVDTGAGTISRSIARVLTRSVAWAEASIIDLEPTWGGQVHLRVKGRAGTIRTTLAAVDPGGDRCMDPGQLRLLADEIARWAPDRARVVATLQAQAEHLESGGGVRQSPLAQLL